MRWIAPLLALLLALLLAGCTSIYADTAQTLKQAVLGSRPLQFTAAGVYRRPYFQMRVDRPGNSDLLILGHVEHGDELWYDGDNHLFELRHGLVVKTANLADNLDATRLAPDDPFRDGLQHLTGPVTVTRHVDLSPGYRYGVPLTVRLAPGGMATLDILGTAHRVRVIDAHVEAPSLHFAADNRYWIDPATGIVWKSRQTLPGGQTLTLTALRPYPGAKK